MVAEWLMGTFFMPLHAAVEELEQSYAHAAADAASPEQPVSSMQHADCRLAVARLSLVLGQVMQDLECLTDRDIWEGARKFLGLRKLTGKSYGRSS